MESGRSVLEDVNRILLGLIACVALHGCEPRDREVIATEGGKAWEHASKAAVTAWNSVAKKAMEITPSASSEAMDAARKAVEAAKKQLEAIPNPTPDIQKKLAEARAGMEKIDAAATLKELQDKASGMVEAARRQAENAGKTYEEVRSNLKGANENYRDLQKRIDEAQKGYEDANRRLEDVGKMM